MPFIDATGLQTLAEIIERFQKRSISVILCGIHEGVMKDLDAGEIVQLVGERNVCKDLRQVKQVLGGVERAPR